MRVGERACTNTEVWGGTRVETDRGLAIWEISDLYSLVSFGVGSRQVSREEED